MYLRVDFFRKRYYYWDMETDIVSWLPPKHPRSIRTESAAKLRERRIKGTLIEDRMVYKVDEENKNDRKRHNKPSRRDRNRDRDRDRDRDREDSSYDRRYKHDDRDHHRRKSRRDEIDPMDPASYSDIPIGTWSDGLESNKLSAADTTVSGALFQQRPYPAPGDILASNKSKTKRTSFGEYLL